MDLIEKLDLALDHISSNYPKVTRYTKGSLYNELIDKVPELANDDKFEKEVYSILEKLNRDNYLDKFSLQGVQDSYFINFEGLYFIREEGGYVGTRKMKIAENARLDRLEKRQRNISFAAALFAGLILLWELLKYFVFDHHWYFHPY